MRKKSSASTSSAPLVHRLAEKQHQLRHLEKVAARYGHMDRFDVDLELEHVRREITVLTQTLLTLKSKRAATNTDDSPAVSAALIEQITEQIVSLKQVLRIVMDELVYLPETLHNAMLHHLQTSTVRVQALSAHWTALQEQSQTTVEELRVFLRDIWHLRAALHPLELREIHRRRLSLMDQQQATHQHRVVSDRLRQGLQADIQTAQDAITAIKRKWRRTPHDQAMLAIYEQNVRWNQEILDGERPYTPIGLLRQMQEEQVEIETIDAHLVRSDITDNTP